jgi:hypothetical protein
MSKNIDTGSPTASPGLGTICSCSGVDVLTVAVPETDAFVVTGVLWTTPSESIKKNSPDPMAREALAPAETPP